MNESIVILGGGYAGLQSALYFYKEGITPILIDKNSAHELLPELPYRINKRKLQTEVPFSELIGKKKINFVQSEVTGVNYQTKQITLKDHAPVMFDKLVLALGSQPNFFNIPGLKEYSLTFITTLQADKFNKLIEENFNKATQCPIGSTEYKEYLTIIIGGGGLTGIEVAGELLEKLPKLAKEKGINKADIKIYLIEAMDSLMPGGDKVLSKRVTNYFFEQPMVELVLNSPIKEAFDGGVKVADERVIKAKTILWTGGIRANAFFDKPFINENGEETKWPLGRGFRLEVDDLYRVKGVSNTYAAGDNALIIDPSTKTPFALNGQAAYKQGRAVVDYVIADINKVPVSPKKIKLDGVLVSLGPKIGVGTLWSPLKYNLQVNIISKLIKDFVELRYKKFDIRE
jgi:NADH dehydrogenase